MYNSPRVTKFIKKNFDIRVAQSETFISLKFSVTNATLNPSQLERC